MHDCRRCFGRLRRLFDPRLSPPTRASGQRSSSEERLTQRRPHPFAASSNGKNMAIDHRIDRHCGPELRSQLPGGARVLTSGDNGHHRRRARRPEHGQARTQGRVPGRAEASATTAAAAPSTVAVTETVTVGALPESKRRAHPHDLSRLSTTSAIWSPAAGFRTSIHPIRYVVELTIEADLMSRI